MGDSDFHSALRGELAHEGRVNRFDGCEPPQPPKGRPGLMVLLVFFFMVVPITLAVVVSDPPVTVWKFIPGLLVGVVLVTAYYVWWGQRRQEGREMSRYD